MTSIRIRQGTSSEWTSRNPVLALGEPAYDTTLKRHKLGDGVTSWNSLPWQDRTAEEVMDLVATLIKSGPGVNIVYDDFANTLTFNSTVTIDNESVQDMLSTFLVQGSGISLSYNDSTNQLTISSTANVTTEQIQDAMGPALIGGANTNIDVVYDDVNNRFNFSTGVGVVTGAQFPNLLDGYTENSTTISISKDEDDIMSFEVTASPELNAILYNLMEGDAGVTIINNGATMTFIIDEQYFMGLTNFTVTTGASITKTELGTGQFRLDLADAMPSYAGIRTKLYDSVGKLYNLSDGALRGVRYTLAECLLDTTLMPIAFIGDSITAGHKAIPGVNDPVTLLRNQFIAAGYPVTGGWVFPANGTTRDARWSTTGTWSDAASTTSNFLDSNVSGSTLTFKETLPGTIIEFTVFCTTNTTITYQIDGSTPVAYSVTAGAVRKVQVLGQIDTTHTLTITNTGTTQRLWVGPARTRRATGMSFSNAAIFGSAALDWLPTAVSGAYFNPYNMLMGLEVPKLVFMGLGANEIISLGSSTPASVATTLQTIGSALVTAGSNVILRNYPPSIADIIVSTSHPTTNNTFVSWQTLWYNVADYLNVALIDHYDSMGTQAQYKAAGLGWTDNIHPLDRGYAAIARRDFKALTQIV